MKPKERFVTALRCGIPDRVPVCDFLFSQRFMQEKFGYTEAGACQVSLYAIDKKLVEKYR